VKIIEIPAILTAFFSISFEF